MPVARLGDELERALYLQIRRPDGLRGQQFLLRVVEVTSLAMNQAQLLEKVGLQRTVTALRDGCVQLAGSFGPVMSGGGDDTIVCQRTCAIQDVPLLLYVSVAGHELLRLSPVGRPQSMRQPKERLAEVRVNRNRLAPGRDRFAGLGLLLIALAQQIPRHHIARLQLDSLFEQSCG